MRRHLFLLALVLAAGGLVAADVELDWDDNAESDLASYRVYRASSPGVATSVGNRVASGVILRTWTDAGVPAGAWYYVVTALDDAGNESSASAEVGAVVPAPPSGPSRTITIQIDVSGWDWDLIPADVAGVGGAGNVVVFDGLDPDTSYRLAPVAAAAKPNG